MYVVNYQFLNRPKATTVIKANWIKPELGFQFFTFDVDVRRFQMVG